MALAVGSQIRSQHYWRPYVHFPLQSTLSGESTKLRRVTVGFVICPPARKEYLSFHRTNFDEF